MGGAPQEFHFGIGFLANAVEALGVNAVELQRTINKNPYKAIPILIWESNKWAHEVKGEACKTTLAQVMDWIDQAGGAAAIDDEEGPVFEFIRALGKSRSKHVPEEEPAEGK